ncbi:MtrAB system histidine kinase MtrB [uncultured Friedmanniella sp.]|uniref:MtrAB system histidine kinase MtrB n=1 Tax=uncultured Friedmanniella sp. TaxID=335381 RepID=UPI0035CAE067
MSVPALAAAPIRPPGDPWWRLPARLWWRSLPLRVIASVFAASVLVLVLGGFLLMQQATSGVMKGKQDTAKNEARQAISRAQQQLNGTDQTAQLDVDLVLSNVVNLSATPSADSEQYQLLLLGQGQTITSGTIMASSIPAELISAVRASKDLLITPTEVEYSDGTPSVAGLAAGGTVTLPGSVASTYQLYVIFPLTQEVTTLGVLRNAVVTTGVILIILLTFIAALVSRQVVTPVRAARQAAESLASGNLHDRMQVRGTDDLARLATSMNYMASELEKQITTLEELSAVQQRFVSDVSHELRTPLTTVRMAAEVLHDAREDFDPVAARSAELLQAELDRFEALLTDLLEISRFDAGAAELALGTIDLRDVVARVVSAYAPLADRNSTTVLVHAPEPALAEVDARRIERILRNLVVNAIEHSESRPIHIWVHSDEEAVAIAVRDHGVGFEAGQAKQVFHRFWRADPARARMVGGTGLGLSIALEDANLHGGWLTAWGRPGLGAQFRLTVPRVAGAILETSPLPLVPRDYQPTAATTAPAPPDALDERGGSGGPLAVSGADTSAVTG